MGLKSAGSLSFFRVGEASHVDNLDFRFAQISVILLPIQSLKIYL